MNRLKLIVLSSALSLITIGVFAGRAKFAPFILYYETSSGSGTYQPLTTGFTNIQNLTTSSFGTTPVTITGVATKNLYVSDNGGTKQRVYTANF